MREPSIDWVNVTPCPGQEGGAERLRLRPFGGRKGDLRLPVDRVDRQCAVTEVLAVCASHERGGGPRAELLDSLAVGTRLQGLLLLCAGELDGTELRVRCPHAECGADFELGLPLDAFLDAASKRPAGSVRVARDGRALELRLPTGRDLARWRDRQAHPESMLLDLIVKDSGSGPIPAELAAEAESALSQADPLIQASLETVCPECARPVTAAVDLEEAALTALAGVQRRLLRSVDLLARTYHWSEDEILELPMWRRRHYEILVGGRSARGGA